MNIVDLSLECMREILLYVAPAAFMWYIVNRAAQALMRAASGRSNGGI